MFCLLQEIKVFTHYYSLLNVVFKTIFYGTHCNFTEIRYLFNDFVGRVASMEVVRSRKELQRCLLEFQKHFKMIPYLAKYVPDVTFG